MLTQEAIPPKMLAAQVVEYNKPYKIHEVPVPTDLDEHDMLVKIAAASLCHTDGMVQAGLFKTKLPCIASHEGAGTVAAIGSSVEGFQVGDRILSAIEYHRCGVCPDCLGPESNRQYCTKSERLGVSKDGSFAEYQVVDSRECWQLPTNLSFQSAAPLACAGTSVWSGIVRARLKAGETLAIVGGGGGLGHLGVQFAKALGLVVIGIDARDEALQLAKDCGADTIIDARLPRDEVVKQVQNVTGGQGADATLNVSDHDSAASTAVGVTKMHGIMVQIAQPSNVSVPFEELVFRDVRIHGSLISSREEAETMLELVSKHGIKVRTNPFKGLKELPRAVELAHSGEMKGKPVILIDERAIEKEKAAGVKLI